MYAIVRVQLNLRRGLPAVTRCWGKVGRRGEVRRVNAAKFSPVRRKVRSIVPGRVVIDQTISYEHRVGNAVRHA